MIRLSFLFAFGSTLQTCDYASYFELGCSPSAMDLEIDFSSFEKECNTVPEHALTYKFFIENNDQSCTLWSPEDKDYDTTIPFEQSCLAMSDNGRVSGNIAVRRMIKEKQIDVTSSLVQSIPIECSPSK